MICSDGAGCGVIVFGVVGHAGVCLIVDLMWRFWSALGVAVVATVAVMLLAIVLELVVRARRTPRRVMRSARRRVRRVR